MKQEAERAAVEVARVAWGFPRTQEGTDRLLRLVWEITAGQDPAAVMIALGALVRRGIDTALSEGRDDVVDIDEFDRFMETWLDREHRRVELVLPVRLADDPPQPP